MRVFASIVAILIALLLFSCGTDSPPPKQGELFPITDVCVQPMPILKETVLVEVMVDRSLTAFPQQIWVEYGGTRTPIIDDGRFPDRIANDNVLSGLLKIPDAFEYCVPVRYSKNSTWVEPIRMLKVALGEKVHRFPIRLQLHLDWTL
jgi:hypothetical protein